jgi:hypothetical protein
MNPSQPFGLPQFDPSTMDPKLLMELSQLIQKLPPGQLGRMQTLMHNMMAGLDVRREMEEFEKSLPPGFREKIAGMMGGAGGVPSSTFPQNSSGSNGSDQVDEAEIVSDADAAVPANMNVREARLTLLRAVAEGSLSPEEAEKLL